MSTQLDDDLVTAKEACEIIGGRGCPINQSTLYRGINEGRYPKPLKLGPGTSRWRRAELLAVLDKAAAAREVA